MQSSKHLLFPLLFLVVGIYPVQAQVTDRFVRIAGVAERQFDTDKAIVPVTVSEVAPNDFRQIRYKSVQQVRDELLAELAKMGLGSENLIEDPNVELARNSQRARSKKYNISLPKGFVVGRLADIYLEGVSMYNPVYQFEDPDPSLEEDLAKEAIVNARQRAETMASEFGKRLGTVLNLEDKSSGCCQKISGGYQASTKLIYRVTVTFELLD
jgi:uncharacterized protein YggE